MFGVKRKKTPRKKRHVSEFPSNKETGNRLNYSFAVPIE